MDKYCIFNKDMYDGKQLVWRKYERYKVTFENEKVYYFGRLINDINYGIGKDSENKNYIVISE